MTKKFTKLMAAFVLLILFIPVAGWGQTETSTLTLSSTKKFGTSSGSTLQTETTPLITWTVTKTSGSGAIQNSYQSAYHGQQFGTGNDPWGGTFSASYSNTVTSVKVDANTGGAATLSVTVGGTSFTCGTSTTVNVVKNSSSSGPNYYEFTGEGTGAVVISLTGTSKACYFGGVVVTYIPAIYTVTLADDNTTLTQSSPGASVTLPTRSAIGAYAFVGWSSTEVADETTTAPTIIPAGAYTPTDDITLYPVYTRTETGSGTTNHTASVTISSYANANNWVSGNRYTTITMDANVTATGKDNGNNSKYYSTSPGTWRHYAGDNGEITIATTSGTLTSVTFTYSGNTLTNGGNNVTSGTAYSVSGSSAVFAVSGTSSNTQVSAISVSYTIGGGSTTYYWSWPSTGPIISANAPATLAYNATGGEFGYSILNPATGVTLNAASNSDWITNVVVNANNSTVTFSTSTNTTYTQRTGTITLSYTGATDKVVTITQEAAPDPIITASNVEIAFDATSGSIAYNITNEPTPAGTMTAAVVSGSTIANLAIGTIENNAVAFSCAANNTDSERTATVTLTYTYSNSLTVTKSVTITQAASEFDYAILPFAFDSGHADIENTIGLTQYGLGTDYVPSANNNYSPRLKFDNGGDWVILHFNERPGELSYDILGNSFNGSTFKVQTSVDGVTYTDFTTYTNLDNTKQHITHNNLAEDVRYIKWIYTNKVNGNVALGNIALDVYQAPQEFTLTVGSPQNVTIHAFYGDNQSVENGGNANVLSSTEVTLNMSVHPGYVLDLVTVYDAQDNLISLTQVSENVFSFIMPNIDVTVSADVIAAHPEYYYTRATSLEPGRRYIIVAERNGAYLAMGAQKSNNRNAKPISVEGTTATVIRTDVHEFTISSIEGVSGYYSIFDVDGEGESSGYLYAGSSSSNQLKTETELDENGHWSIAVDPETGEGTLIANGSNTRNVMRFNQDNGLFSCYAAANSGNQYPVYLYMKDDGFDLTIDGYADDNVRDGYYLIASPVEVAPADVPGLTEGTFDLYYYDDSHTLEWINYETSSGINPNFGNLVPGKGYLYAKKATTPGETYTFTLTGEVYDGDGTIELVDGWNLIGNPFNSQVEPSMDYYEMNEEGSEIIVGESWVIEPMQGIFINNEYGESGTSFSIISKGTRKAGLTLNLSKGASKGSTDVVIDRAIVRFGEGRQLPKFQLFENSTKVYIPQSDKDYAVVRSADEGEMPVNFKAERNGTYTLSMNVEEVSLGYLHLVDNMTGTDVDLLATPSYTFEARTTDYESRFKLVFSASQVPEVADGQANFAFFNGSGWTVSNMGEATLQVVDVMGRVVSSHSINGNATIHLDETPGVYMLRLVNGNNVKVQKIVVR